MNLRVKGQRGFDDAKGRLGKNDDADDEGDVTKVFQSVLLLTSLLAAVLFKNSQTLLSEILLTSSCNFIKCYF